MSRKQRFYWHVPEWGSDDSGPVAGNGLGNVGNDIVVELVNTDFAAPGDPRQDNFVTERVVGQYMIRAEPEAEVGDRFVHNRVYVADGDQNAVSLRDLYTQDDADSSFLWHQVMGFDGTIIGLPWGMWSRGGDADLQVAFEGGRLGNFDIRVGRRIEEGQSLIWHTQLDDGVVALANDSWRLFLWVRVLMREG